ncbi:hypothetical protein NQ314_021177 [Rhamnusium bicolor]|uniref:Uncharacterized protein n=1 Tax=Rhamnusium bicolor TaxID=1586634 RepID=A0AAV8WIV4_9CUCU|nr:hypothetical protein NQ314_021177 [Rhamnusium bicolor]
MNENIICRLCLEVVPIGYTLVKENIQNTIKALTSIDVTDNDNLPKLSCSKCIFNLYFVDNIRKLIIKSDEKLHSIFSRDGNFNELLKVTNVIISEQGDYHNIEIKEEKVNLNQEPEILKITEITEQCVNSQSELNDEISKQDSVSLGANINYSDSASEDENNIRNIIYIKNNTKPYLYHCKVCNVDFRGHKLYMTHKGKHMKRTCEICGVTTRQDNFNKHMTNHNLGQQVCDICGSIHKSLEGLRTHLFHFHNAKKKPYTCSECGAVFKYSHRLTYHKKESSYRLVIMVYSFRPHQCDSCGKRFFDLGTMKKHVKLIHLKLREHHCKYCQKDYSSRHALKVHVRQHTDETPYVCEICSEGFRQLVSLKTHMAKHDKAEQASTSQIDQLESQEEEEEEDEHEEENMTNVTEGEN